MRVHTYSHTQTHLRLLAYEKGRQRPQPHLGVDGLVGALLPVHDLRAQQRAPDGGLATTRGAQQEHAPAHHENLTQLADLEAEGLVRLVAQLYRRLLYLCA